MLRQARLEQRGKSGPHPGPLAPPWLCCHGLPGSSCACLPAQVLLGSRVLRYKQIQGQGSEDLEPGQDGTVPWEHFFKSVMRGDVVLEEQVRRHQQALIPAKRRQNARRSCSRRMLLLARSRRTPSPSPAPGPLAGPVLSLAA
jgi:hypothetical protein